MSAALSKTLGVAHQHDLGSTTLREELYPYLIDEDIGNSEIVICPRSHN